MKISYLLATFLFLGAAILGGTNIAEATTYDFGVYAYDHSLANAPLDTGLSLSAGEAFSVSVDPTDIWSAGAADRTSNADGLGPTNPYGGNYGLYSSSGFSFYYGSLVGQIDSGDYFLVGTSFNGTAGTSGNLKLLYWDSNYGDNSGYVTAHVTLSSSNVPEPSAMLLLGAGLIGTALLRKRQKN